MFHLLYVWNSNFFVIHEMQLTIEKLECTEKQKENRILESIIQGLIMLNELNKYELMLNELNKYVHFHRNRFMI